MLFELLFLILETFIDEINRDDQWDNNILDPYFPKQDKYKVGLVLYQNLNILDLAGPVQVFDNNRDIFEIVTIANKENNQIAAGHGALLLLAERSIKEAKKDDFDIIMIPGTRLSDLSILENKKFIEDLKQLAERAKIIFTICTGSLIVAKTGLIDNIKATTNKMIYNSLTPRFPKVNWTKSARFVHNKKYITSSGNIAGLDAAIYILGLVKGECKAKEYTKTIEYKINFSPDNDSFINLYH